MSVAVWVPRRSGDPHRDAVWAWVRDWWARELPELPAPIEGVHEGGPFNRSAAINDAYRRAHDFDVAVIADADSIVDPAMLRMAISRAGNDGQMVIAFTRFAHLTRAMTARILAGYDGSWEHGIDWALEGTCSSMIVVPGAVWEATGGFDERFSGWGWEDVAFCHAASTFGGGFGRMPGTLWHLWHRPARGDHGNEEHSAMLANRYRDALHDLDAMRQLCAEHQAVRS